VARCLAPSFSWSNSPPVSSRRCPTDFLLVHSARGAATGRKASRQQPQSGDADDRAAISVALVRRCIARLAEAVCNHRFAAGVAAPEIADDAIDIRTLLSGAVIKSKHIVQRGIWLAFGQSAPLIRISCPGMTIASQGRV
jgi:hypothetical protein